MTRTEIETALRATYAARARNDAAETGRIFAPDATFRDAGNPELCFVAATHTGPAIQTALAALCDVFPASAYDVATMIIEGERAAAIVHATFRHKPTDQEISLDLVHFWTFKDDKATELVEYFDTAHVNHFMAAAAAAHA